MKITHILNERWYIFPQGDKLFTHLLPKHLVQRLLPLALTEKGLLLASLLLGEALTVPHGALVCSLIGRDGLSGDASIADGGWGWGVRRVEVEGR